MYVFLPVASRIRDKRAAARRASTVAAAVALGLVLISESTLSNGERAQAETIVRPTPLIVQAAAGAVAIPVPEQPARLVRTVRVTSGEDLLAPPAAVITCEQPAAGTWRLRGPTDRGCSYVNLTDPAEPSGSPAETSPAAETPRPPLPMARPAATPAEETAALLNDPAPLSGRSAAGARQAARREAAPEAPAESAKETAKREPPAKLLGTWQPRTGCSRTGPRGDCIPLVIDATGAKAGSAICRFLDKKQDGNRFSIRAQCTSGGDSWTANVRLVVAGNKLTWSSERGSQQYVR